MFSIGFLHFRRKIDSGEMENNSFTGIGMMKLVRWLRVRAEQGRVDAEVG